MKPFFHKFVEEGFFIMVYTKVNYLYITDASQNRQLQLLGRNSGP